MKALILAGGFGKRLRDELTFDLANIPKPLLPVAGKPVMEYIIKSIDGIEEIDNIYVLTIKKFEDNFNTWRKGYKAKKNIKLVYEPITHEFQDTGAIGGLGFFIGKTRIDDDLLVIAGDNLFTGFELKLFLDMGLTVKAPVIACFDMGNPEKLKEKYGEITLNNKKEIILFREKPKNPRSPLASTACYFFPKDTLGSVFDYLADKQNPTDAPGHFIKWLAQKDTAYGFPFPGQWFDIGSIESLEEANLFYRKNP
jgi:glucose-1-phosphate thymidylyltransferase